MSTNQTTPQNIDEYIAGFPPNVQKILRKVRSTIRAAAPQAEETLKYQMPTYTLNGNLVYFAGYKEHIGVYPVPAGTEKFQKEIVPYRSAKSTARFPLNEPIPYDLIGRLVEFRVKENRAKAESGFLSVLSAPARRALEREGITTLKQLSHYSEKDILKLHGVGPSSMPKLRQALKAERLSFRKAAVNP